MSMHISSLKYFFIIFSLLSLGTVSVALGNYFTKFDSEYRLVIHSSYKRSKEVWGSYDLYHESASLGKKKERLKSRFTPISNLILERGKAYLMRPVASDEGHSRYQVSAFPYKNKKRRKAMTIDINKKKDELYQLYREQIENFLQQSTKRGDLKIDNSKMVKFGSLSCSKSWTKINCQIPMIIKI